MTHPFRLIHNSLLAGLFFSCTGLQGLHAQQRLVLDLERTIALANDSSLESFRTQNMYLLRLLGIPDIQGEPPAQPDAGPYSGAI